MKTLAVFVLTLGIVGVIANPVSKQTIQSENKNPPQAESSDSQTKHGEVINMLNKGDQEQKKDTSIENSQLPNIIDTSKDNDTNEKVEIIIEENIIDPVDDNPPPGEKCDHDAKKYTLIENSDIPNNDSDFKDVVEKVEIIIEENLVSPPDESSQGDFEGGPPMPGFEDAPVLLASENIPPGPQLSAIIGEGPQMPDFMLGPHSTGEFSGPPLSGGFVGGPQLTGFIEERPQLPGFIGSIPHLPGFMNDGPHMSEFNHHGPHHPHDDDFHIDKDYFQEDMQKVEHEIMETAAGFVPTPLVFRRKHKPRRRFATRRHFRRNPYRRHQFFHPYSYNAYYRPSSLRFY